MTPNIHAIAAALARRGGMNDASQWVSDKDPHPAVNRRALHTVLTGREPRVIDPAFAKSALSFQFFAGLDTEMPSTTPIAFTRGLQPGGTWAADQHRSIYGSEGGYIVFLGGNVAFYKELGSSPESGRLISTTGARTANILEAIDDNARIFSYPATATGAVDGMPGQGVRE